MIQVILKPNERVESLIKRFTKKVRKSGLFKELEEKRYYDKQKKARY